MTRTTPARVLLELWREVGRHLDLGESLSAMLPALRVVLPLRRVVVRRLDGARRRLDTAAAAPALPESGRGIAVLDERAWAEASAWARRAEARVATLADALWLGEGARPALVGPLSSGERAIGVVVFELTREPEPSDLEVALDLLEPLAAALENDSRLHELARLREAAEAENRALLSRLGRQDISDTIVGSEAGLKAVMTQVDQVAPTDAPVLVLGETGSGKEVVARSIHAGSRRRNGPFLRVNCGAIPPELVDSELFGHERGSFTGAVASRKGWFERADGGTLFLDEVGELPPAAQVRLLRVLQDGTFERVGGQATLSADVRLVAATHRDVPTLVRQGQFREDLWYRISVFPVRLPPLRERRGDIAALAAHFAARAGLRLHGVALAPGPDDLALLRGYDWPGNVRELAAVVERAAILGGGRALDIRTALGAHPSAARRPVEVPPVDAPAALEEVNRAAIVAALTRAYGRVEGRFGAAQALGINPSTLRSRMQKLGIDPGAYRKL